MKQFAFSAFFVAAALAGGLHNATGQAINATVQTAVASRGREPQHANDSSKARCDRAGGAPSRSLANRFEPSEV